MAKPRNSRARTSGKAARKRKTPISSRFLCPRPPLLLSAPNQNRHATQASVEVRGSKLFSLLAGSLASQSTPERRSKSREGKTTFDWLLRHCFVHTQTQKSWAAENTNQNWNINGGIAWERRLISGRCFSVFSLPSLRMERRK